MDLRSWLSALGGSPAGAAAYGMAAPPVPAQQPTGLAVPPMARGTKLSAEMDYDGTHPRQQEQAARDHFRSYGPQTLADAFIPGYGAGGDAKAASEAFGEGRYGAAAGNALMAAMDFVPVLGALPAAAKGIRAARKYPTAPRSEWWGDANYEATGGRIVEMTPDEFLGKARPMEVDEIARENIDDLKAHMESGKTLDPLAIWKNGKEDGRHRAHAAKELGIERVPVLMWDAPAKGIRAYHGSPHDFNRFDMSKIGTGEGAQAYGHGLYFAESEGVAKSYRDDLGDWTDYIDGGPYDGRSPAHRAAMTLAQYGGDSKRAIGDLSRQIEQSKLIKSSSAAALADEQREMVKLIRDGGLPAFSTQSHGRMYEVNIDADPADFLDWDAPLSAQGAGKMLDGIYPMGLPGGDVYQMMMHDARTSAIARGDNANTTMPRSQAKAAEDLRSLGIPGIRYLDAGSRGAGDGSRNYVVFDDRLITILRKYGIGGLIAGGGAYALTDAEYAQAGELLAQDGMNTGAR
jgi:hypothetical protein